MKMDDEQGYPHDSENFRLERSWPPSPQADKPGPSVSRSTNNSVTTPTKSFESEKSEANAARLGPGWVIFGVEDMDFVKEKYGFRHMPHDSTEFIWKKIKGLHGFGNRAQDVTNQKMGVYMYLV